VRTSNEIRVVECLGGKATEKRKKPIIKRQKKKRKKEAKPATPSPFSHATGGDMGAAISSSASPPLSGRARSLLNRTEGDFRGGGLCGGWRLAVCSPLRIGVSGADRGPTEEAKPDADEADEGRRASVDDGSDCGDAVKAPDWACKPSGVSLL
jgi:hypothetical protein